MYWNHNVIVKIITISLVITRLCKYLLINSGKSIIKRNIVDDTFCTLFSLITSSLSLSVSVHFFFSPPFPSRYVLWTEWHAYVISIMMMIGFSWSDLKLECFRSRINGYAYITSKIPLIRCVLFAQKMNIIWSIWKIKQSLRFWLHPKINRALWIATRDWRF